MKNYQNSPRVFTSKEGLPKADCTNDRFMVDNALRVPKIEFRSEIPGFQYDFSKTEQEKMQLATHKANYKKLKKNPIQFKESSEYIIKEFIKRPMPNFGSFIFN